MSRPSMSPEFDQRIADWLEDDPDRAPAPVLETVLAALPSIPQRRARRISRRTGSMTTMTSRLLAGTAALVVLVVGGALLLRPGSGGVGTGASPTPSSRASASSLREPAASTLTGSALTETFTSTRYGYSVRHPSGWAVVPSSTSWQAGVLNTWGSGINDELTSATVRFSGASQPLTAGQTPAQWLTAYANGGSTAGWSAMSIGGQQGSIDYDGGPANGGTIAPGGVMFDAVIVVGGRAYNFNMDGKLDRAAFDAFLGSITLDPGATASSPTLSQAFTSARHGYSIRVPADWLVKGATAPWPAGTQAASPPDPMLDVFTPISVPGSFVVASSPLLHGVTADAWLAAYEKSAPQMPAACWPPAGQMEQTTIDGKPAWIHGGQAGCGFTEAITFAGGRVYELTAYDRGILEMSHDMFLAYLGTVKLDPASANDAPAAPRAP